MARQPLSLNLNNNCNKPASSWPLCVCVSLPRRRPIVHHSPFWWPPSIGYPIALSNGFIYDDQWLLEPLVLLELAPRLQQRLAHRPGRIVLSILSSFELPQRWPLTPVIGFSLAWLALSSHFEDLGDMLNPQPKP